MSIVIIMCINGLLWGILGFGIGLKKGGRRGFYEYKK